MKKLLLILSLTVIISFSQAQTDTYVTSGMEMIFSFADVDYDIGGAENLMRWAPAINFQSLLNVDFSDNVGIYTGLGFRNVGYILDDYMDQDGNAVKKKFRTYNLGIPFGLKLGKLDKAFVYGGYEIELPFHYKEKTFLDDNKTKKTDWFSNRVEQFQHGVVVGVQLPYGTNIKFKYYFSEFHNQGYAEQSDGFKPYEGLTSNVFYFSLNFTMFKNGKFYYED
jgi:hypothetical protein